MIGFEYPLFTFFLILEASCSRLQPGLSPPSPAILLPPDLPPAKHSTYLSATLLHGTQTFLYLSFRNFLSISAWLTCFPLQRHIEEDIAHSLTSRNLRIQKYFLFFPFLQPPDHYCSLIAPAFARHPCLWSNSGRKDRLKETLRQGPPWACHQQRRDDALTSLWELVTSEHQFLAHGRVRSSSKNDNINLGY